MNDFFKELGRRNVFRVAGAYAVVAWLLSQIAVTLETSLELPNWFDSVIVSLLLVSFPIALLLAWAFELTPGGLKRTDSVDAADSITQQTGRGLDIVILAGLGLVIGLVAWQIISLDRSGSLSERLSEDAAQIAPESVGLRSIAVLPFDNNSPDADQDYFANGISEELLNGLARVDDLRVSSRTSAFVFKGQDKPISEIAAALDVGHVLDGSVRKSGNTLRITAQLIDTTTDQPLWSETYDRALTADNIFLIQDEITAAIISELGIRMDFSLQAQDPLRTDSTEAYEIFLRARENMELRRPEPLRAAEAGFREVILLDPDFVPAYSNLVVVYSLMREHAGEDIEDMLERAQPMLQRALDLAPNSAETLTAVAVNDFAYQFLALSKDPEFQIDFSSTLDGLDRAISINPNFVSAYHYKGLILRSEGELEAALTVFEKALELDPLSTILLANKASIQRDLGNMSGARRTSEQMIRWDPESHLGYMNLARLAEADFDFATAHRYYKEAQFRNTGSEPTRAQLLSLYQRNALWEQANPLLRTPEELAFHYFLRGELDAFESMIGVVEWADWVLPHNLAYHRREFETHLALFEPFASQAYPEGETPPAYGIDGVCEMAYGYYQLGSDESGPWAARLSKYFEDKAESDLSQFETVYFACLQVVTGQPDSAIAALSALLEQGPIDPWYLRRPEWDDLRDEPAFVALHARNERMIADNRAEILNQLANPEPNWVFPTYEVE